MKTVAGYEALEVVLEQALMRASTGKGKQRHGSGRPFHEQPLMQELRTFGITPAVYQIRKKAREAVKMVEQEDGERAIGELLDVIVYAAAAVRLLFEAEDPPPLV